MRRPLAGLSLAVSHSAFTPHPIQGWTPTSRAPAGSVLCCMLPDTGERYLSTPLFEGVATEMTDEEVALSKWTPGYQMQA